MQLEPGGSAVWCGESDRAGARRRIRRRTRRWRRSIYRCLDYLATTQLADFKLETSLGAEVVQGVPIEAQAVVTAYGGGAVADAEVKIDLPAGAAVTRLVVDGEEKNPQTNWTFVNVPSGAEHRLSWTLTYSALGPNATRIHVDYTSGYGKVVEKSYTTFVALAVQEQPGKVALIGGPTTLDVAEVATIRHWLELVGWTVDVRGVGEFGNGLVTPAEYDVTIFHFTSADPTTLPAYGTALTDYLNAGGMVFLSGTAPKMLDRCGVTPELFAIRGVTNGFQILNVDHPIAHGNYTAGQNLTLNNATAAYLPGPIPTTLGIQLVGQDRTFNSLGQAVQVLEPGGSAVWRGESGGAGNGGLLGEHRDEGPAGAAVADRGLPEGDPLRDRRAAVADSRPGRGTCRRRRG